MMKRYPEPSTTSCRTVSWNGDTKMINIRNKDKKLRVLRVEKILQDHLTSRHLALLKNLRQELIVELLLRKPAHLDLYFLCQSKDWQILRQFLKLSGFVKLKEVSFDHFATFHKVITRTLKGRNLVILDKNYYSSILGLKDMILPSRLYRLRGTHMFQHSQEIILTNEESFLQSLITSLTNPPELLIYQLYVKPIKKIRQGILQKRLNAYKKKMIKNVGLLEEHETLLQDLYQKWGTFKVELNIIAFDKNEDCLNNLISQVTSLAASYNMELREKPRVLRSFYDRKKIKSSLQFKYRPNNTLTGFEVGMLLYPPNPNYMVSYEFITEKIEYKLPKTPNTFFSGDVFIGYQYGEELDQKIPLYLSWEHLSTHMSIFGMTGEGKTHLASNILKQAITKGVKCLIFDPKGEYHSALSSENSRNHNLTYLRPGSLENSLHLNIFEIPRDEQGKPIMSIEEHQAFLIPAIESLIERQDDIISPQMRQLLYKAIEWTVSNEGNLSTFLEVLENPHILGLRGNYIENSGFALINRFAPFTFGTGKYIFQCTSSTINPKFLLENNVIIDLSLLEAREDLRFRTLLINYIIHVLFHYLRRSRSPSQARKKPSNIILIDEIQKILPFMGANHISVAGQAPWTLRAYGISMIFVGTDPHVEKPILTNTGISIVFFSKAASKNMAMVLGISMKDYDNLKTFFKHADSKYKALVSYRGKIFILEIPPLFDLTQVADQNDGAS